MDGRRDKYERETPCWGVSTHVILKNSETTRERMGDHHSGQRTVRTKHPTKPITIGVGKFRLAGNIQFT